MLGGDEIAALLRLRFRIEFMYNMQEEKRIGEQVITKVLGALLLGQIKGN